MADPNHSLLIVVRGSRREVVTRPGHLDIKTAMGLAARAGGTLHVLRHHRTLPEAGQVEVVRIQAIETV
jgi:hypothetical protein